MNLEALLEQLDSRWKSNKPIQVEQLACECFGDAYESMVDAETWLELICNEVVLREQRGERPTLVEYQSRFPGLADVLSIQWDIDRLLSNHETNVSQSSTIPNHRETSKQSHRKLTGDRNCIGLIFWKRGPAD